METEEETEKEAEVDSEEGLKEEVESGLDERNPRRAGLEIEAVARSVPDLTEPEFDLEEENRDGRRISRGDSVDVDVASPRFLNPDVRTLFCVAAWKSVASSASFALSNSSSQVQPFFLALANFGAQVSSTMMPVFPSCPGLFPPDPSRTAMHFLTLLQASPQFLGSLLANAAGTMRSCTTRRRLARCIVDTFSFPLLSIENTSTT